MNRRGFQNFITELKKIIDRLGKLNIVRLVVNLFWVYLAYLICRISFIFENWALYSDDALDYVNLFKGGMLFDTAAICYTNILFIVLFIIAGYFKEIKNWANLGLRILFTVVNGLFTLLNFVDSVIFTIRQQRSTALVFKEFGGEVNTTSIAAEEILPHWYLIVLEGVFIYVFWKMYLKPLPRKFKSVKRYSLYSASFLLAVFLTISGMRGTILFMKTNYQLSVHQAFSYTDEAKETGIILNTPFTLISTLYPKPIVTPHYFSKEELAAIYSPVHMPNDSVEPNKKNVVILILESFSAEFIGALNPQLEGGKYKGYTPFLDELVDSCLWYDQMIANTFYSVDAPPALFASIPRAYNPFVVSEYAGNEINSIASELGKWGYTTSFFLGADNKSLGINDFVTHAGFRNYFGKNEYLADNRFGGMKDFDGRWGIWDEPFLQYFCTKLSETPEPFLASLFTISSHHPFHVPEKYKDVFKDTSKIPIHKVISYTDYALRRFFEEARKQEWFKNTIFVISADHTSSYRSHKEYKNELGDLRIPILIYDPSGELPRGKQEGIIQQIDIMPTLLNHLGYDRPYVAFGKDVLSTPAENSWAFNWNNLQTLMMGDYVLVMDEGRPLRLYNHRTDPKHTQNLLGKGLRDEIKMDLFMKAFLQSFIGRMNRNDLTIK